MLKEKLQQAVAELQKSFSRVVVRPGTGEGAIDITLDLSNACNADAERLQALEILKAHGLKAHGFVATRLCSKIFLRNVSEISPAINPQSEIDNAN